MREALCPPVRAADFNMLAPSAPLPPGHLSSQLTVHSLDNVPASSGPSEVQKDETVAGN